MTTQHTLTPIELCDAAAALLDATDEDTAGLWPRAAALLARQGLEVTLGYLWRARAPGCQEASMRAQLAALPGYLRDPELAGRTSYAWWALTRACHFHHFELPPTRSELDMSIGTVRELVVTVMARV